jgi:amino acid adenylation domain-containing protein
MKSKLPLVELLSKSASTYPQNIAVTDPQYGSINYEKLDSISDLVATELIQHGVTTNHRVGLWMSKSVATVSAIFGILKCGAAYVPTDASGPPERNSFIFQDCSVTALLIERTLLPRLELGMAADVYEIKQSIAPLCELGIDIVLVTLSGSQEHQPVMSEGAGSILAYILYTSGSTGVPKGVAHTHSSAISFIDWCSQEFSPVDSDRFSSHAPFHFDLSILDIYVPIKHGACIYLIPESLGKQPAQLAEYIASCRLTYWYSTPSILRMLTEFGELQNYDFSGLKNVFFAGEVYPIKQLQQLCKIWQGPAYYNLYGPTETNVCTYYKLTSEDMNSRDNPVPIGKVCSADIALICDAQNQPVKNNEPGELCITGGSVMTSYWNAPEKTKEVFYIDAQGQHWYKTGDIVVRDENADLVYMGRQDRMVKKRGFRVELGEIESVLYRNSDISEAAVIAISDDNGELLIYAILSPKNPDVKLSVIKLKQYCSQNLPYYMVPDRFKFLPHLPKTSTDKIDYQAIKELI